MIERSLQPERADRWAKAPAQMREPLDEVWRQPKIIRAQLPIVFALAQSRIGKRLAIGVH